ncbi:hypothetical protein QE152_g19863 [Popillia japonica]|uniref:Uncharacterized protein n=1 Tax=Popillia japonica TaxID=7064 RepID=A0AAW1KPJ7_POPJA
MWTAVAPCDVECSAPSSRSKHSATLIGDNVYLLGGMAPCDVECSAPSSRSKHSATLIGDNVYLLGGRNGNLPLKDFWRYNLVTGKWQQLKPDGDKLPCLQEHSAVAYKDNIYVFGGEVGFSAGSETPLWCYDVKNNCWRKMRPRKGVSTPKGRRGHTALVHKGSMLIYGGYQDLKGSCGELWAYHFETESWHLLSRQPAKSTSDSLPPPRHKHSAVIHDDAIWIYGGMTDLQERSDLWKWDIVTGTWIGIKTKVNPGPLHSHAACRLPSCMLVFGGERDGHPTNDLWKFNFSTEMWEKITINGIRPQPRAESVAFTVSELVLNNKTSSLENKASRTRLRTCTSVDRGSRHSSYMNNRVEPYEQTYVFSPSHEDYTDGSELLGESTRPSKTSFLQEISKLSQINIARINNRCSYTVLTERHTDSTESLLRQAALSPGIDYEEYEFSTPTRGTMIKSKSAYVIKKKFSNDVTNTGQNDKENLTKKRVEFDSTTKKIPRDPISVPNFNLLTLPTPVLTPVEAARLVYLDTEEENYHYDDEFAIPYGSITQVKASNVDYNKTVKRGDSYNSHLAYADNPLYQHMISSGSTKLASFAVPENFDETVSSTSDYFSIDTVNRLSSASNYSIKMNNGQEDRNKMKSNDGVFGFSNPNYLGPDIKNYLEKERNKKEFSKTINNLTNEDVNISNLSETEDILELQTYDGTFNKNTKVYYKHVRNKGPPKSLPLDTQLRLKGGKSRASSASRAEKNSLREDRSKVEPDILPNDKFIPLFVFILGGKEQGQVTVFQRPLSIWKLKLF